MWPAPALQRLSGFSPAAQPDFQANRLAVGIAPQLAPQPRRGEGANKPAKQFGPNRPAAAGVRPLTIQDEAQLSSTGFHNRSCQLIHGLCSFS